MELVQFIVGRILPYVTIVVLVVGLATRLARWGKGPAGKMTLYPGARTKGEMARKVAEEVLIFRGLFEGNRSLWLGSWVFHAMLAFIFVGHIRVVWEALFFLPPEWQHRVSAWTGGTFGVIVLVCALYLLARRLMVRSVREISDVEDFAALFLIIAIVLTGDAMRFIAHFDLAESRAYFASLVTFQAVAVPNNPWFLMHYFLGMCLFLYLPFSKFLHIPGVFYSQTLIQKA